MSTTTSKPIMAPPPRPLPYSSRVCSGVITMLMPRRYLPLLECEVNATILSWGSKSVLKQTFGNPPLSRGDTYGLLPSKDHHEYIYQFPMYDGVSVVGFKCNGGSKSVEGVIKEKNLAESLFQKTASSGNTTALFTQTEETSDVFTARFRNIPSGEIIFIEITYISEPKYNDMEGIRFTIPSMIAPRYGVPQLIGPHLERWRTVRNHPEPELNSKLLDYKRFRNTTIDRNSGAILFDYPDGKIKITIDVILANTDHIRGIESPSHSISVSMGTVSTAAQAAPVGNMASVTLLQGTATLEKDFLLFIQPKNPAISRALLETHSTISNHRALMITLVPEFSLLYSPIEIVFVAGHNTRIQYQITIAALMVFLKSIPYDIVKFNICSSVGSEYSFLWPQSRKCTQETCQEAIEHISSFESNGDDRMELIEAIRATIECRKTDLPLKIIICTDGNMANQPSLFSYINEKVQKKSQGEIRLFSHGIGNQVSYTLIEALARAGDGLSTTILSEEQLEKNVNFILRGALSAHTRDYVLEVKYREADDDFELVEKATEDVEKPLSETGDPTNLFAGVDSEPLRENGETTNPVASVESDSNTFPRSPHIQIIQAPYKIPSLYPGSKATVYLLMGPETIQKNPTSVILRSASSESPQALEIPIEVLAERDTTVHQLAARKVTQDIEEGRGWMFDETNAAERESNAKSELSRGAKSWSKGYYSNRPNGNSY